MSKAHELMELRKVIAAYHVGLMPEIQLELSKVEAAQAELLRREGYVATVEAAEKAKKSADAYSAKVRAEADVLQIRANDKLAAAEKASKAAEAAVERAKKDEEALADSISELQAQKRKLDEEVTDLFQRRNKLLAEEARIKGELQEREEAVAVKEQALKRRAELIASPL